MTDEGSGPDPTEPVGSVGEEAAKLFAALAGAAKEQGGPYADAAAGAAAGVSSVVRDVNEHLATGAAECTWCPVCRVIHAVRQTSPEVRQQLAVAAGALAQAAAGLLATDVPRSGAEGADRNGPVQRIDLDDEADQPDDPKDQPKDQPEDQPKGPGDGSPGHS